ncbi:hypothetical protein COCMIDRAFT_24021 [Bipolaris oryzae ATCC 44560]|uniref:Uncharacterized protein n=1 Tax=Bipolaris oryzae ATCC 44560 TaxID=930090 RepID=W6ZDR0_COCMI|nr:uncharacterized protein COCMIDRAFT_24021 [Bipolaris oryzae ATCC 44560]EUC48135.1 hypothetical protein COCMIDRAFT_24021 [Bipolaris oryzae ATCC 44560]
MKFSTSAILLPIFLSTATNAWELTLWKINGQHITTNGHLPSGCVTFIYDMSSPVNRAVFSEGLIVNTFELYEEENCGGKVSYRDGQGEHSIKPPRVIKSYRAY